MSEPIHPTTDLVSHTPGPWDIQSSRTTVTVRSAESGEVISSWYAGCPSGTVTHANARLISAAPELRDVVRDMIQYGGGMEYDDWRALVQRAEAVLAKAGVSDDR